MECKAWVDECSAKCVEEEDEQCSDECKKILAEHEVRCYEECSAVPWEYGEVSVEEVPKPPNFWLKPIIIWQRPTRNRLQS